MNEKLKELYLQAGGEVDRSGAYFMRNKESTYKFAELIVRECAKIAWLNTPDDCYANQDILDNFGLD
jgi:hypothetical protein